MGATTKKYSTNYKKKSDTDRETFLPQCAPAETIQCTGCGAFYYHRRWTLTAPVGFTGPGHVQPIYCPACRTIKEHRGSGEVHLLGVSDADRSEIMRLMRNEENHAREKNPLERIMGLETRDGDWKVETTTEKLAQRLGRSVCKARGGKVAYKWSHNNKFVRVIWEKRLPH